MQLLLKNGSLIIIRNYNFMKMRILFVLIMGFGSYFTSYAQITIDNTQTPQQLVQNVLLGAGITASNIIFNGSAFNASIPQVNASSFDANGTTFPIGRGVLLTNGASNIAPGPNNLGGAGDPTGTVVITDADMAAITPNTLTNGAVLEFDFIATGDTLNFQYMFASEEYPNDYGASFYDVFGFFISGPGFAGPFSGGGVNIATLPGTTTPISILNLNPTTNTAYYINNEFGAAYGTSIQYDGTSIILTASAQLQCGQQYHIKLGISNVGDQAFDSGVFIQAESFASNLIQVETASALTGSFTDTLLAEGCTTATLNFIRPLGSDTIADTIPLLIGGTINLGLDLLNFSDTLFFPLGVDTVSVIIDPIADGISESTEYIEIGFYNITACGDSVYDSLLIYVVDEYPLSWSLLDTVSSSCASIEDSAFITNLSNSIPPYSFQWTFGATNSSVELPMNNLIDTTYHYVTITDGCGDTFDDTLVYITDQTLSIDSVTSMPTGFIQMPNCRPTGLIQAFVSGQTEMLGLANYNWTGPDTIPGPYNVNGTAMDSLPSGWYYFTVTDDVCTLNDSVYVDTLAPPMAGLTANVTSGCTPLSVTFSNTSLNTFTYFWDFGNTNTLSNSNESSQSQTYTNSTQVMLVAYDANLCSDTTFLNIDISVCGCMDPEALNYDPMAVQDDESCVFPLPEAVAPNVFTPNNDGDNDVFFIQTKFSVNIELTILNRWGNLMYEKTIDLVANPNTQDGWNGLSPGGNEADEGTYFYKYKATGIKGDVIEGHGFLQLVRD